MVKMHLLGQILTLALAGWVAAYTNLATHDRREASLERRVARRALGNFPTNKGGKAPLDVASFKAPASSADIQGGAALASPDLSKDATLEKTPTHLMPKLYNATLEPNLETYDYFEGLMIADFDVVKDTQTIFMHSGEGLNVTEWSVVLALENGTTLDFAGPEEIGLERDMDNRSFTMSLLAFGNESIPTGASLQVRLAYNGSIFHNEDLAAWFQVPYTKADGTPGTWLQTQFESTLARRVFPIIDDPSFKTNFSISLIVDEGLDCVGNMDIVSSVPLAEPFSGVSDGSNKKLVTFGTTPIMSSYLLGFGVAPFKHITATAGDWGEPPRVPVRIHATPEWEIESAQWLADLTARAFGLLEDELGVWQPMRKVDFTTQAGEAFGGMENWGVPMVSANIFVTDMSAYPDARIEYAAELFMHELSHFWAGDLVTHAWWGEIWLGEGLADFLGYWSLEALFPELDRIATHANGERQYAMDADLGTDSHPLAISREKYMEFEHFTPFDDISYCKGASVMFMIRAHLGHETFMGRLGDFYNAHAFGNIETPDLIAALGDDAEELWGPWIWKSGHPYLFVTEPDNATVHIEQVRRTGELIPLVNDADEDVIYPVPLLLRTAAGVDRGAMLREREDDLTIGDDDFYFINADSQGLYRVAYPSSRLRKLAADLDRLSAADVVSLLGDTATIIAESKTEADGGRGKLTVADTMTLIDAVLARDDRYWPIKEAFDRLGDIINAWGGADDEVREALVAYKLARCRDIVDRLGWPDDYWNLDGVDASLERRLRAMVFYQAGSAGDEKALQGARDIFGTLVESGRIAANGNLWEFALRLTLAQGKEEDYEKTLDMFMESHGSMYTIVWDTDMLLSGLAQAPTPALVGRTMEMLVSMNMTNREARYLMRGFVLNREGAAIAIDWAKEHWTELTNDSPSSPVGILRYLLTAFPTQEKTQAARSFAGGPTMLPFASDIQGASDEAAALLAWVERDTGKLKAWIDGTVSL